MQYILTRKERVYNVKEMKENDLGYFIEDKWEYTQ